MSDLLRRDSPAAALTIRRRVSAASCFDFRIRFESFEIADIPLDSLDDS